MWRRDTIAPATGMMTIAPVDFGGGQGRGDAFDEQPRPPAGGGETFAQPRQLCPICGKVDLTTWTLPDREAHADACLIVTFGEANESGDGGENTVGDESIDVGRGDGDGDAGDGYPGDRDGDRNRGDTGFGEWLASLGLVRFAPAFFREELTSDDLPSLTDEDLRDVIGMDIAAERARFLAAAAAGSAIPPPMASDPWSGSINQFHESNDSQPQPRKRPHGGVGGGGGGDGEGVGEARLVNTTSPYDVEEEERLLRGNIGGEVDGVRGLGRRGRYRRPRGRGGRGGYADREERVREDAAAHDDEWLRLALALSASMDEAPAPAMTTSGDYGWIPVPTAETTTVTITSPAAPAPTSVAPGEVVPLPPAAAAAADLPPRRDELWDRRDEHADQNGEVEPVEGRERMGDAPDREEEDEEKKKERSREQHEHSRGFTQSSSFSSELAAARARAATGCVAATVATDAAATGNGTYSIENVFDLTPRARRRAAAPLWSAAGHGGKDVPLPSGVLSRYAGRSATYS